MGIRKALIPFLSLLTIAPKNDEMSDALEMSDVGVKHLLSGTQVMAGA